VVSGEKKKKKKKKGRMEEMLQRDDGVIKSISVSGILYIRGLRKKERKTKQLKKLKFPAELPDE
jgi:hypothetical protein